MPTHNPYKRVSQQATYNRQRGGEDPMSIDARRAATQRTSQDYLKPRPRHDDIIQSENFPAGRDPYAHANNPLVVDRIDTTVKAPALATDPHGIMKDQWPTFKEFSPRELNRRAENLVNRLTQDGLNFQALSVTSHQGSPVFMLYLDRALRDNDMVPTEQEGVRVQRMTVGKFRR